MKRRSWQVEPSDQAKRLDAFLARELALSDADAAALVVRGAVYVDGRRCIEPPRKLKPGERVMAVLEESGQSVLAPPPSTPEPAVLFEDSDVLAVDKPAGLHAQPTAGRVGSSLSDWAAGYLGRPAGLVHRLDRETSGVTVFGKNPVATRELAAQFREGTARKQYLAATGPGLPDSGIIDLPLSPDPSRPGRYRATRSANGVPATTRYQRLYGDEAFCLVALFPQTGRTHQLRAHLTALGTPILGDRRYGGAPSAAGLGAPRCLLHARVLQLKHPKTSASLTLTAPVPSDLATFFERARCEPP